MSKLSELFHKSETLEPDSIEELYIKELEAERVELMKALEWFCNRVDAGEVRSKRTYERTQERILSKE